MALHTKYQPVYPPMQLKSVGLPIVMMNKIKSRTAMHISKLTTIFRRIRRLFIMVLSSDTEVVRNTESLRRYY